jgi:hypothetical protein
VFGWIKAFGGLRQFKLRGQDKVSAVFGLHVIAYNLIPIRLFEPEISSWLWKTGTWVGFSANS